MRARRGQVFISYSHHDKAWLERLQVHLRPLERDGLLERWDDTRIQTGGNWRKEIRQALASTKVAVLLISADFLASDFIVMEELPPLLAAAEAEGTLIVPVILSPSRFVKTPLAQFQAINPPSRPLVGLPKSEQEAFLVRVADAVERGLRSQSTNQPHAVDSTAQDAGHASTNDHFRIGRVVIPWLRQKKAWALLGAGVAFLALLLGWHFSLSKPERTQVQVRAEGGVAAGGDIKANNITIVGPHPAPPADKAQTPVD